jgi:enamine deaminase RidA (YjgF/YER057c/UK114 family)
MLQQHNNKEHSMQRDIINPWTWQEGYGFVHGNKVSGSGELLFAAGQSAIDAKGQTLHIGNMEKQIDQVLANIAVILEQAGMDFSHVVRLNIFTVDLPAFMAAHAHMTAALHKVGCRHVGTLLGVTGLAASGALVEMEVTAAK